MKNLKSALIITILLFLTVSAVYAQTAEEHLQDGNASFKQDEFDQSIIEYTKALDIDPNLTQAYNNRGVAYAQEGSLSRAIADFTMAIANNFNDAEAYNNRGHAYAEQGNFSQAIADYTRAIRIDAFYVKAYNNRELVFYKLGEYDKAWADVHTAQAIGGVVDPTFIKMLSKESGKDM